MEQLTEEEIKELAKDRAIGILDSWWNELCDLYEWIEYRYEGVSEEDADKTLKYFKDIVEAIREC